MTGLGEPRELTGTRDQVTRTLTSLNEAGLVRTFTAPEPHPQGCRVWWWMRQPEVAHAVRPLPTPATRPMSQAGWTLRDLTPGQRKAIGGGVTLVGVGAVLTWAVLQVVRAFAAAASWAGGNPVLAILVGLLLAIGGVKVAAWRYRRAGATSRSGGGCQGIICHCPGCRGH